MKNVVIIGGGTGTHALLSGLRGFPVNIAAIVSSADDGGSSGELRKDLGVFPPGDIRQCLLGLSYADAGIKNLFNFRFNKGFLKGHNAGNIILAALEKLTGGVEPAINSVSSWLQVSGSILPVTLKPTLLMAVLASGKKIVGEHNIDRPRKILDSKSQISQLMLKPNVPVNYKAITAIRKANVIVLGPGDLYTSILPNLLVKGIKEAVDASRAKRVLIASLMTKPGQTDGFSAADLVRVCNGYLGRKKLDTVVVNNQAPTKQVLKAYQKVGSEPVKFSGNLPGIEVVVADLISKKTHKQSKADKVSRSLIRHDSGRLAKIIYSMA